ncbi:MAG TPA: sodium:solute symporter family protein [Candidatus Limnocylindrales bacterium]|jgi:SSS family solute:Na+ symporter|nr:sodium:solute symporter family protein [Candidatus Limnocylindrales bacterium]
MHIQLGGIDYAILLIYFAFVLSIGWALKRYMKGSTDFFLSGRSIPAWVTGLAFLSANLGAQEVIGMAASGAKYGIMTSHFYWVGAIPAMVFLAIFMMPFYYGSRARSVPEYLKLRFDEKTRGFNAISFAVMTVFSSGISMHALARLMETLLGWNYNGCIAISALIVLAYIFLGGLTSAIYNEVLQFFMIVFGFAPLVFLGLKDAGGWAALKEKLVPVAVSEHFAPGTWTDSWKHMGSPLENPMGIGWFGMVMGLGFVLSFGYWCTDFLVVQRAMAADSMSAARRTPLIAAIPKMLFPALVILPGMIAIALHYSGGHQFLPIGKDGTPDYNLTIPAMLAKYFPTGLLGIGFTALMASFMSGMAGNVTAFNTVWTYDIYQSYLAPNRTDKHYLAMGRWATVFGILVSVGAAYLASKFNNIMDMLQLVFGFVNAPLFATFLLGMFWRRTTGHGAFVGLLSGTLGAAIFHGLALSEGAEVGIKGGWLGKEFTFHSEMGQNFWMAIVAWTSCFVVTILVSLATERTKTDAELKGLVYSLTPKPESEHEPWYKQPVTLGVLVLAATVLLNIIFW